MRTVSLVLIAALVAVALAHGHSHDDHHGHSHGPDDHSHSHAHSHGAPKQKPATPPPPPPAAAPQQAKPAEGQSHGHSHDAHGHSHGAHDDHAHAHTHGAHEQDIHAKPATPPPTPKAKPPASNAHGHSHDAHGHSHGMHGHSHGTGAMHGHSHGGDGIHSGPITPDQIIPQMTDEEKAAAVRTIKHSSEGHKQPVPTRSSKRFNLDIWMKALGSTLLISAAPILILLFIPLNNPTENVPLMKVILGFAVGGLLGDVFLHLLPHISGGGHGEHGHTHSHGHSHGGGGEVDPLQAGLWVIAGIFAFFIIEKLVRGQHGGESDSHGHSHAVVHARPPLEAVKDKRVTRASAAAAATASSSTDKSADDSAAAKSTDDEDSEGEHELPPQKFAVAGYLNLVADMSHNFTDGLAIGATFVAGEKLGIITTLAILLHEVPHEIGDFAILIQCGLSKQKAMLAQLLTACGALLGTVVGLLAEGVDLSTAWILPFTAGGFIYISLVTVMPELLKGSSVKQTFFEVIAMSIGVGMMLLISLLE